MIEKNYGIFNYGLFDNIIVKKRSEMLDVLNNNIKKSLIKTILDIGTIDDDSKKSSNYFIQKLNDDRIIFKSISNQKINNKIFKKSLKKSITSTFSLDEFKKFKSDLVISSATIEHVGNFNNQKKMIKNIFNLTKKYFFITTPNRFFPIDFHTKIPFIHMLPKNIHRNILNNLGLKEYAKESNLNLVDEKTIKKIIKYIPKKKFKIKIFKIKLFLITSNLIIFGERKI